MEFEVDRVATLSKIPAEAVDYKIDNKTWFGSCFTNILSGWEMR